MATINYCDYTNGNDTTGDGSAGNPYKTITKASTGLTGGDEVRCAASASATAISVNLTWTNNSVTVTATGADITGEVAVKDFIGKATAGAPGSDETYWEVTAIVYSGGNTTVTLGAKYDGTSGTAASQKCGVFDTGTAAAVGTAVQAVSASGTAGSFLLVSGGWNLATQLRTGQSWYWQSGTNRYGLGLSISSKAWVKAQYLGFLRYDRGFYLASGNNITVDTCTGNGCGTAGLQTVNQSASSIVDSVFKGNVTYGLHLPGIGGNQLVTGCIANSNKYGAYPDATYYVRFIGSTFSQNTDTGIYLNHTSNALIVNCTTSTNTSCGIYILGGGRHVANNLTASGNGAAIVGVSASRHYGEFASIGLQRLNGVENDNRQLFEFSGAVRDDSTFNTAAPSIKFTPSSATYYLRQDFVGVGAASTAYTLGIYLKKSADFNGDVQLEAYNSLGALVTGPTAAAVTTSWAQYTIAVAAGDMPVGDTLFLRVRVRGTAGTVWADDFSVA